jgi:AcrR family transcriptional regulator
VSVLRARDEESKRHRRRQLLASAAARFDAQGYEATTIAQVASDAGLAKGTTYLYFRSKESLFLALLLEALEEWRSAAAAALGDGAEEIEAHPHAATAEVLASTFAERPRLVRLLALYAAVLVPGAGSSTVTSFEESRLELVAPLAENLARRLPKISSEEATLLILRAIALVAGLADLRENGAARPPAGALPLGRTFDGELTASIAALLRGTPRP